MNRMKVAVVGAGIVGLANAWSAAKRGHEVTVFDRSTVARGASVRNFGMVWPIGQPTGGLHDIAMDTRARWLELSRASGLWVNACGSIHLAHRDDEWAVVTEFAAWSKANGNSCRLLTASEVLRMSAGANPDGLIGGLFSEAELCVNPRTAIAELAKWLAGTFGVQFEFGSAVKAVEDDQLLMADGRAFVTDRVVVCGGADFETLFPEVFTTAGLTRCKLQMLRTVAQPDSWWIGPHLASGLTLRHYRNFDVCKSLAQLQSRIAQEAPELDRLGIHVMASQNEFGEVILGDSHEYDDQISPFDKVQIDDLILSELRKVIRLPVWTIAERWNGIYAKNPRGPLFLKAPHPNVRICTATGGAGMTMSFGLAERVWEDWDLTMNSDFDFNKRLS